MSVHNYSLTVPGAVREMIRRNYPIYQCLKMKLTNYHSLAELLLPQVQEMTGRKTSINTLVVAIKRFSDTLEEIKMPDPVRFLKDSRISLSSGIVDVTIRARKNQFSKILTDLSAISDQFSEFPHVFPLATTIKVILPTEDYGMLKSKLKHLDFAETEKNVAKLTLYLSPGSEKVPGIASYITELLYRNGINIVDAFLGYRDVIIIVSGQEGPLAYDTLQKEMQGSIQTFRTRKSA